MQWLDVLRKVAQFLNQISQSKLQQNSDIATAIDNDPSQIAVATDTMQHQVSKSGCELICGFEGLALTAYDDGTGCWTIGYGTTRYPDHTAVKAFDTCSVEDANVICNMI